MVRRKRRVVDPAALQQSQAFVAPDAAEATDAAVPPNEPKLSADDKLEIAAATGSNAGLNAVAEDEAGQRLDQTDLTEEQNKALDDILAIRFAQSKSPTRDIEIAKAYLLALRSAPKAARVKVQEAIGSRYGISATTVRSIGNPEGLVAAGKSLGFTDQQVRDLLEVTNNSKNKTAAASEQSDLNIADALRDAGVETAEGDSAGFGADDNRAWTGAGFENGIPTYGDVGNVSIEAAHNQVVRLLEAIDQLKESASAMEAQGQYEAAQELQEQIQAHEKALELALEKAKGVGEAAAKKTAAKNAKLDKPAKNAKPGKPAEAASEDLTSDREAAATAWDRAANRSEGALPQFEELTDDQQATFIGFGRDNWTLADVNLFAENEGLVNEVQANDDNSDDVKFGKEKSAGAVKNGYTAAELLAEIKAFIRADVLGRKLIVVNTIGDLLKSPDTTRRVVGAKMALNSAYGVAADGTAYLVADRIRKGTGKAKFMHEVGSHLGLENLLPGATFSRLVSQIRAWAQRDDGSPESKYAKAAIERAKQAGTSDEDVDSEVMAYFIESAVEGGIDPTADVIRGSNGLREWFRTLWAAFKTAVRRLGFKPETLTAQDVVNLAFGAARLEIAGTWHGTAAAFRQFNHKFMNSGEGAQAYGWGTYLAQQYGIALGYWEDDVSRKTRYISRSVTELPDGSIMRVDVAVGEDETLDWDAPLLDQPDVVVDFAAREFPGNTKIQTGGDLYKALIARAWSGMGVKESWKYGKPADKMEAKKRASEALDAAGIKALKFLDHPSRDPSTPENEQTRNLVVFNDKNIFRVSAQVAADKERMRFGKDLREKLPTELQKPVGTITNTLRDVGNAALNTLTFTEDVINRAISLGVKAAGDLRRIYQERAALTGRLEREVERVLDLYNKVPQAERGTGSKSVNQFLYDATREGKWGFKPDWRTGFSAKVTVDQDMKQRFDALSKESQALVRAVFKHGDEVLSIKKQTVMAATDTEYDAQIAAAKKANDTAKEARLVADKQALLGRFKSLFEVQEFRPYAPLRRFGDYVVIARSKDYLAADEKTRAKLEKSEDHYHVSFAESAADARELVNQLQKQGSYADVVFRQKEAVQQTMFGGTLGAFNKLRASLDAELADAQPGEKAALRAARKVVGELYLSSLAEDSARKSEMRRRGVAGEIDVLRSFSTQGRADAQFIAGAKYNNQTLDAFNAMRKQVKEGGAEEQNTKSGVFNELMKRHTQSMQYDPSPIADKLTRLSSIWYLATSPAYYLQNLTQPFMLSLPVMAGRFNYMKVFGALLRAYADLGPMFKTAKLGEQFNYGAAPADVRDAISKLVDRGRIDIGMDTELGTFRIEGDGAVRDRWNKVDRKMRNLAQKMESVNRLSTAIAAYRMALASTGNPTEALEYADSIINQTHGDYTRTNAPRAFNTSAGKLALQFRKFQLIQLTLMAKLLRNSFVGDDRKAALQALSFVLSHTAVMAGAVGLPGFAAISWALGAMLGGGDDEPFNLEKWLREFTGDEDLATLLTRGVPAAMGVDLSSKLGMGNVLSLLPFNDLDLSSRSGVESAMAAVVGGPAGSLGLRAADGLSLIRDGQYYRGVEQLMPTGVTNAMKANRFAAEGVTRRNGDVLISSDEISGMQTFWQAIGFQPAELAVRQFRDRVKRETDEKFQGRADKIRGQYLRAKDDPEVRAKAREQWVELQDARGEAGYRRQPLSSLFRSEQSQRERERNTVGGIQFNRDTRRFVEDLVEQ